MIIYTDEMRLQQVLLNFVSNALKFTPRKGSINIVVNHFQEHESWWIGIKVIDTGIGISKEDQLKLFQMFGMLDSTKEINTRGIGLGLHITKLIVTQFSGDVYVKSNIGEGSEFGFKFKLENFEGKMSSLNRIMNPNI